MAARKALVLGADGLAQQLQAGDTIGANAFFTAPSAALPLLTALGNTTITLTVSPVSSGDNLAKGEVITVTPSAALPGGLNIAYAIVTATNTVQIGLSALVTITAASVGWTVVAHR